MNQSTFSRIAWLRNYDSLMDTQRIRGTPHWLSEIPPGICQEIRQRQMWVVIDATDEACRISRRAAYLMWRLRELALPPSQIIIASGNFADSHQSFDDYAGYPTGIHWITFSNLEMRMKIFLDRSVSDGSYFDIRSHIGEGLMRPRKFVCLNRKPRHHRLMMMNWLKTMGWQQHGWCSWPDSPASGLPPMSVDVPNDTLARNLADTTNSWVYRDSYFTVVGETHFYGVPGVGLVGEKVYKPIANCHPWLIVGNVGSLDWLRSQNYQTFHPHIDETYDTTTDDDLRMTLLQKEIAKLCNMSPLELDEWYWSIFPILEYNRENFWQHTEARWQNFLAEITEIIK